MSDTHSDGDSSAWQAPKAYGWSSPGTEWREMTGVLGELLSDAGTTTTSQERELERRLVRLSVEYSPIFLFVLDGKGTFILAAGAGARAYVDESGQIVGRSVDAWVEDVPDARAAVARALEGEIASWEGAIGERYYEAHLSPVLDPDGGLVVVAGVAHDLTARHLEETRLRARESKLRRIVDGTALTLGSVVEEREPFTAGHQRRTAELAVAIARTMDWTGSRLDALRISAQLHDIGRLSCPAEALNRPGPLYIAEIPLVQAHAEAGAAMLADMGFEDPVVSAVRQHHERLDGSGYPDGLTRGDILPEARIIAVADVLEARTSARPHRGAYEMREALGQVRAGRGRLFDHDTVDACVRVIARGFKFGSSR